MFETIETLVLASSSPRRQNFLYELGISFTLSTADIDETPFGEESPCDYVKRMARMKCGVVAERFPSHWILAADTIVFRGDTILGKPVSQEDAIKTLMVLSGQKHRVSTAFSIGCKERDIFYVETVITKVYFTSFSEETARAYVNTGEPMDKAGAYGIQGLGGVFIKELRGSYSNVVGLPLSEVIAALIKYGIVKTKF